MNEGIPVNYTSEASKEAEENFPSIIESLESFGVEPVVLNKTTEEIIDTVSLLNPRRLEMVSRKSGVNRSKLSELPQNELLDKLLGIDHLFSFQGHVCAVDIATGKASTLINKKRKFEEFVPIYRELGIEHALILRIKGNVDDDILTGIISKVDEAIRNGQFILDLRF